MLHAADATNSEATTIDIVSPDTDVFVLAVRRSPELCQSTNFGAGGGQRHKKILVRSIATATGPARTAVLLCFHAWSRVDVTGRFAGKGKPKCWNASLEAEDDCISALSDLGKTEQRAPSTIAALEKLVDFKVIGQKLP